MTLALIGVAALAAAALLLAGCVLLWRGKNPPAFTRAYWAEGTVPNLIVIAYCAGIFLIIDAFSGDGMVAGITAGIGSLVLAYAMSWGVWKLLRVSQKIVPYTPASIVGPGGGTPGHPANDRGNAAARGGRRAA